MATEQEQAENTNDKPKKKPSVAKQLKEKIANFLLENFEVIEECFEIMPPKEKVKVYRGMLAFVIPKVAPQPDPLQRLTPEELDDIWESLTNPPNDSEDSP